MSARQSVPAWSTSIDACRLILRGVTFQTGIRVALVVGTVLTLVNQGSVIAGGDAIPVTWVRVGVNYLVPFLVSSFGYLAPFRDRGDAQPAG
ncbi:MAG: nitrate/nitrite transporter NrtS [Acidimicrobiia bacterium]